MIKADHWIRVRADAGMIQPFEPTLIRQVRSSIRPDALSPNRLPSSTAGKSSAASGTRDQSRTPIAAPLANPTLDAQVKISIIEALATSRGMSRPT